MDGYVNGVNVQKVANQTEKWKTEVTQRLADINATALPICSQIKVLLALEGLFFISNISFTTPFIF